MSLCDLCLAPSGLYQAKRECCQIRLLATMPQHARLAAYARSREVEGKQAETSLREKVKAEYQRLNGGRIERAKAAIQSLKNLIGVIPA